MKTIVDTVEVLWLDSGKPAMLTVHFNNTDELGEILPGAGGYVTRQVTALRPAWNAQTEQLVQLVEQTGRRWILDYDDWTDDKTPFGFIKAEFAQYRRGDPDCGGHFRFQREEDFFASSLLFEYRGGVMTHNQKRPISDKTMLDVVLADIAGILAAGQSLAATINAERVLSQKNKQKGEIK